MTKTNKGTEKSAALSLETYRAKRDFSRTAEPRGEPAPPKESRRGIFCVQKHLASQLHYDLRLEHRGVLLSWAVPKGPSLNPQDKRLAMMTEDHPLDYADFEGLISEGYGKGIVMLWDCGTWRSEEEDIDAALEQGRLKFCLDGSKLKGSWTLVRAHGAAYARTPEQARRAWLLMKHRDEWAAPTDITAAEPLSATGCGDFADILARQDAATWPSPEADKGGAAAKLLRQIIAQAADIQAGRRGGYYSGTHTFNGVKCQHCGYTRGPNAKCECDNWRKADDLDSLKNPSKLWRPNDLIQCPALIPDAKGVYAWYFDRVPDIVPTENCVKHDGRIMLYIGIAGQNHSSNNSLRIRITQMHLGNNSDFSTLRRSLGCLLMKELGFQPEKKNSGWWFGTEGESKLTRWITEHACVVWVENDAHWELEKIGVEKFSLPLNLKGNKRHPFYSYLKGLRKRCGQQVRRS